MSKHRTPDLPERNGKPGPLPPPRGELPAPPGAHAPVPSDEKPGSVYYYAGGPDDEVNLWDYLGVLLRRRWTVTAFFATCVLAAMILSFASTPMYTATALVQIQPGGPNILSFEDVQESMALSQAYNDFFQTQYDILSSRTLARRTVDELDLDEHPWLTGEAGLDTLTGRAKSWVKTFFSSEDVDPETAELRREHRLLDTFLENVEIRPRRKSFLVEVSFQSPDAGMSADVADTMAREYIDLTLDQRIEAAAQGRNFIAKQLDITKARLEESEQQLHQFARGRDIYALEQEEHVIHERLADLNTKLTDAESDRIKLEALQKLSEMGQVDSIPAIVTNPLIASLKGELAKAEADKAEMSGRFKEEFPEMRVLDAKIRQINLSIRSEIGRVLASITLDYEAARAREVLLQERLDNQRQVVAAYEDKAIDFKIMRREVDTNRTIYEDLLRRLKEVEVAEAIRSSNITLVDHPEMPLRPSSPNIPLNLALASLLGLFGGVGLAFFQDYMDDSVKTPDDIERYLRLPTLGAIPEFKIDAAMEPVPALGPDLQVTLQPTSAASEAIRTLRASLFLAAPGGVPTRLLISSARPSEGKTCIAVNLAAALAQMGRRVVVMDCDLRRPRVHKAVAIAQSPGVTNFLTGNIDLSAIIVQSGQQGLDVIPAGPIPPNPVDLLDSVRMGELIRLLEDRYDHILVDAPPALGFADVPVLSNRLGGACLLVTRSGSTSRRLARQACEYLIRMQSKLLGVVLNRVSTRSSAYSYYGYYGYYGSYGHYGDHYAPRPEDDRQVAVRESA